MHQIIVINEENDQILMENGKIADHFLSRLKGLLGVKTVGDGEGLMILPCNMVHTIGMKTDIDVLFVSDEGKVFHVIHSMKPGKMSPCIKNASYVIELPAGKVKRTGTIVGQKLSVYHVKEQA
ncbi:MAG: DUF192 domain-containing protein [Bacillota bacterium]|nr:DUF192 domain-containing protein [Bacillota bacterium]